MPFILSFAALIFASLTIYAKLQENEKLQFIFKPLAMLAIILLVFLNSSSPMSFYQKAILTGLIFSLIGDVFLVKDKQFFIQGLISFLLGHVCYIAAFWTTPNLLSGLFYIAYIAIFLLILWKTLGNLKIPVIIYSIAIALMSWMAFSRYFAINDGKALLAFLGSVSFVASDSFLAFNKFKNPLPFATLLILATYFLAQWLIALSV